MLHSAQLIVNESSYSMRIRRNM